MEPTPTPSGSNQAPKSDTVSELVGGSPTTTAEEVLPPSVLPEDEVTPSVEDEIRRGQEDTRKTFALTLVWTLIGLLFASFLTIWIAPAHELLPDPKNPDGPMLSVPRAVMREEVLAILQQALAPLITLIGTVAGFYFGGKIRQ